MTTRSDFILKTIADCTAFLAEMEATAENRRCMNSVYGLLANGKKGLRIEIDKIVMPENLRKFIG